MKTIYDILGALKFLFLFILAPAVLLPVFFWQQIYQSYLRFFKGLSIKRSKKSYYDFGELIIRKPRNREEELENRILGEILIVPLAALLIYVLLILAFYQIKRISQFLDDTQKRYTS